MHIKTQRNQSSQRNIEAQFVPPSHDSCRLSSSKENHPGGSSPPVRGQDVICWIASVECALGGSLHSATLEGQTVTGQVLRTNRDGKKIGTPSCFFCNMTYQSGVDIKTKTLLPFCLIYLHTPQPRSLMTGFTTWLDPHLWVRKTDLKTSKWTRFTGAW